MPSRIILPIYTDKAEKDAVSFPEVVRWYNAWTRLTYLVRIKTIPRVIQTGDYCLGGSWLTLVKDELTPVNRRGAKSGAEYYRATAERKGSIAELNTNLFTSDESRFIAELARMEKFAKYRVLFLDFPVSQAFTPTRYIKQPTYIIDKLMSVCTRYGVEVQWVPPGGGANRVGKWLARWFLSKAYLWRTLNADKIPYEAIQVQGTGSGSLETVPDR